MAATPYIPRTHTQTQIGAGVTEPYTQIVPPLSIALEPTGTAAIEYSLVPDLSVWREWPKGQVTL